MTRAFSLVELSIVLVILGLLTGGILAGQSLIRASELRAVSTEYQRWLAAMNSFRDKYMALPGDMPNATAFWGTADGTGSDATCAAATNTTSNTCNGDGNGAIDGAVVAEKFNFWKHLANAGLIEGSYVAAPLGGATAIGTNYPRSKLGNNGWEAGTFTSWYAMNNYTLAKLASSPAAGGLNEASVNGVDGWNLDTKMDDGIPSNGRITALDSASVSGCVTNGQVYTAATTGTYILTSNVPSCRMYFRLNN